MSTENALLTILVEKINNDTLVLPTLPAIALKVREAADDPETNLNKMAEVVGQDPALSARMIKIANSAYLGRTIKVESLSQAVTRIGLRQVKNIATALAMEQLFVSRNETIKQHINKVWDRTVDVVANSMALLQHYVKHSKEHHMHMDAMTLAALVYNIGVLPIFTEAERHDDVFASPNFLNTAVQKLSGRIGSVILKEWGFNEELISVAENWRNMQFQTEKPSYIDMVRLGSALAGHLGNHKDEMLQRGIDKGIIASLEDLESEDFIEMRDSAKQIFS